MEGQELARYDMTETAMSPETVVKQVGLIQQIMRQTMREGEHFGIIPGCQKPSLLKPGAEKLSLTFRLSPAYEVIEADFADGHREYRVTCTLTHIPTGQVFGQGLGICSTMESKYRYRGGEKIATGQPIPKEYWNLRKDGKGAEAQALLGGKGFGTAKVDGVWQICEIGEKAENPDIADTYNTVLKMGKKRAHVDAVLTAVGASDIFTQDVEDMQEPPPTTTPPATKQPEPAKPAKKSDPNGPSITSQTNAIGTLLTHLGIMDDMARAKRVSDILGLTETITDTKKLTYGQAVTVIETLGKEVK